MSDVDPEGAYVVAKRRLDLAAGRLTSLDAQIVDIAGAMAFWRASWRRSTDPESAVTRVISQAWPDQAQIEAAFEEWLAAYYNAVSARGRLPAEAQLRLNEPSQPERSALS